MALIEFKNKPDTSTPINADNLNHNFNKLAEINYLVATITNEQSLSSNYVLQLDKIADSCGDKLTFANGKIVVGAGVSKVRVSGSIFVNAPSGTGYVWAIIRRNEIYGLASSIAYAGSGTSFMSSSIPTSIARVQEGDIIDLVGDSTCGGVARAGYLATWLCVEVIE